MSDPKIDVAYIARLADISLTEEETARFSDDLNRVLDYMSQLQQYDVDHVEPMYHPLPSADVMRDDMAKPGLTQEAALALAPQEDNEQIRVPKVVESA